MTLYFHPQRTYKTCMWGFFSVRQPNELIFLSRVDILGYYYQTGKYKWSGLLSFSSQMKVLPHAHSIIRVHKLCYFVTRSIQKCLNCLVNINCHLFSHCRTYVIFNIYSGIVVWLKQSNFSVISSHFWLRLLTALFCVSSCFVNRCNLLTY